MSMTWALAKTWVPTVSLTETRNVIIELDHCRLRPLADKDIDALYVFRNDPAIISKLGGFSTGYSKTDLADWLDYHRKKADEILWVIADNETDRCFGHVGLYNVNHRVRKAELAVLIGDTEKHRKGLGSEVCAAVVDYGFSQLNLNRIELSVLANNQPALRLYEKLGFRKEGVLTDAEYRDSQYVDVILMAILRTESGRT